MDWIGRTSRKAPGFLVEPPSLPVAGVEEDDGEDDGLLVLLLLDPAADDD